jgi:hypothetical protein
MRRILRFRLFFNAAIIAGVVLVLKYLADRFGLSQVAINTLTSSFFAGVFFTISILFTAAMADFKEAEKIPGEMAVMLKALHNDALLASPNGAPCAETKDIVCHVEDLLSTITDNLRHNHWHKKEIDNQINLINADVAELWRKSVTPGILLKLREHLTNIDRLSHRIDYIAYTNDIPGASLIADIALAAVFLIFVFAKNEWGLGGLILFAAITFVLCSIMLLIHDMDNPFEYNMDTLADVDMSVLFKLDELWRSSRTIEEISMSNSSG